MADMMVGRINRDLICLSQVMIVECISAVIEMEMRRHARRLKRAWQCIPRRAEME
jgi:hypothetical protein